MPTAKGWSVHDIKRLTGRAAPGPWLTLTVVVSDSDRGPATADGEPWKGV